jgi:hypothetical protein
MGLAEEPAESEGRSIATVDSTAVNPTMPASVGSIGVSGC